MLNNNDIYGDKNNITDKVSIQSHSSNNIIDYNLITDSTMKLTQNRIIKQLDVLDSDNSQFSKSPIISNIQLITILQTLPFPHFLFLFYLLLYEKIQSI